MCHVVSWVLNEVPSGNWVAHLDEDVRIVEVVNRAVQSVDQATFITERTVNLKGLPRYLTTECSRCVAQKWCDVEF